MKTFYDFIRRTSGKLNEAAGQVYDWTKEEDIFFTSTIAEDGNKYYQLRKLKNGKLTTSAIVDIGVLAAESGLYYVLTYSGSRYEFDVHNLDEDYGINGEPPIGSKLKLMWKEIKEVAKKREQQQQQQTPAPAAPAANTPRAILGVSETATPQEITAAYRKLARDFHPDRNPGDETAAAKFRQVQDAYDELTGKGAQQRGTIEQGAPNQQQTPASVEQYKELIQHIMGMNFELYMQKAIDEINNPTHEEIKNMPENDKKEFIEFVLTAPSYRRRIIEHDIGKLNDNIISHFGRLIKKAIDPLNYNDDDISYLCSTILIMILGKIKEEQVKQQQQEDSQEHLLALARQLNNPKIRKGLVYMINGNPGRVSVWAAEIKTPQDLQKKYEDWVRRGLVE